MKKAKFETIEKLRELRTQNHYTYQYMSDLLDISKTFYWQIENQKRNLSYAMAYEIAKIFAMKPDEIFFETFNKK